MDAREADSPVRQTNAELTESVRGVLAAERRAQRTARGIEALLHWARREGETSNAAQRERRQLIESVGRLARTVEELVTAAKLLEAASAQQQLLGETHYERHIIEPMVSQLLLVMDLADEVLGQGESDGAWSKCVQAMCDGLEAFLQGYGVELYRTPAGGQLALKTARPIQSQVTHRREFVGRVARSLRAGARRGDHILRVEKVAIYRYEAPEQTRLGSSIRPDGAQSNRHKESEDGSEQSVNPRD